MSFGFGVGDFLKVVQLAHKTYEYCRNSTTQFKDIGRDVGNAHIILKTIGNFWKTEVERGKELLLDEQEQLKQYSEECESTLVKLEKIAQRYGGIEDSTRTRLRFAWKDFLEDFAKIRESLRQCTSNLATFHIILTQDAILRRQKDGEEKILKIHLDVASILEALIRNYVAFQNGEKEEPAFSQISRGTVVDKSKVYDAANDELNQGGIRQSVVQEHQPLVKEWLNVVILAETGDRSEDNISIADSILSQEGIDSNSGPLPIAPLSRVPYNQVGVENALDAFSNSLLVTAEQPVFQIESKELTLRLRDLRQPVIHFGKTLDATDVTPFLKKRFDELDWIGHGHISMKEVHEDLLIVMMFLDVPITVPLGHDMVKRAFATTADGGTFTFDAFYRSFVNLVLEASVWIRRTKQVASLKLAQQFLGTRLANGNKAFISSIWDQNKDIQHWIRKLGSTKKIETLPFNLDIGTSVLLAERFCAEQLKVVAPQPSEIKHYLGEVLYRVRDFRYFVPRSLVAGEDEYFGDALDLLISQACQSPYGMHPKLVDWPLERCARLRQRLWYFLIPILAFCNDFGRFKSLDLKYDGLLVWESLGLSARANEIIMQQPDFDLLKKEFRSIAIIQGVQASTLDEFYRGCLKQTMLLNDLQTTAYNREYQLPQPRRFQRRSITAIHISYSSFTDVEKSYKVEIRGDRGELGVSFDPLSFRKVEFGPLHQTRELVIHPQGFKIPADWNRLEIWLEERHPRGKVQKIFLSRKHEYHMRAVFEIKLNESTVSQIPDNSSIQVKGSLLQGQYRDLECVLELEHMKMGIVTLQDQRYSKPTFATAPAHQIPPGWRCIRVPFLGENPSRRICFLQVESRRPTLALWQDMNFTKAAEVIQKSEKNEFGFYEPADMSRIEPLSFTTNYGFTEPAQRLKTLAEYGKSHLSYNDPEYWL